MASSQPPGRPRTTYSQEQQDAFNAAIEAVSELQEAENKAWHAIARARRLRVPADDLAEASGVSRATVFRWAKRVSSE